MDRWITLCGLACLLLASLASSASVAENEVFEGRGTDESGPASILGDLRFVYRLYTECDASPAGVSSCLKLKLATAVDRAVRKERMSVLDGIEFVKSGEAETGSPATEEELEANLPRSLSDRETALDGMILDKVLAFFQTHTLQFKLADAEKLGRSLVGESGE
ncbi:hypothetical protein J437_LFUL012636 [Ladona fulva]|uniref:Calcitonin n=1 Tax=Ladona fulva TaxID=123851 RepID=A0A8K0KCC3_LADFU|nr:hypothetical protein J437_LFUL012636 [Ladona fulva]